MSDLEDIAVRFQVYLERLKASTTRDFNRVMPELIAIVEEAIGTQELSEMSRTRIEEMIRGIVLDQRDSVREYLPALIQGMKNLGEFAYEFEAGAIMETTTAIGLVEDVDADDLWKPITKRPMGADGSLLEDWLESLTTDNTVATANLVRRAHAEGWNSRKLLQAYRGTRANRFTDGIVAYSGRNNETVIRTALQHVASTARMQVWKDNPDVVSKYKWVSTLDNRTSSKCRSLDGQEFEVGKGPVPPGHRNCRSTTVAVVSSKYDFLDRDATRASATGRVAQSKTYYQWLAAQSAEYQDSVIGPTRGKLLRNGGLSAEEFARLQLNRLLEPLTLDEMRRLKPLAFKRAGI